jgi:transposase
MSWIRRVKRGNQYYLYEVTSVLENGKVKQKLIRYLGVEGDEYKVPKPKSKRIIPDKIYPERSLRAGDVTLLWKIAEALDIVNTLDRVVMGVEDVKGPSPGKYLTVWAINRILDPESATQLEPWVRTTTLPVLAGMEPSDFTKDAFLRSLDSICSESQRIQHIITHIPTIEDQLYQKWRTIHPLPIQTPETIAFDLTAIPTFGKTCTLAEPGHKSRETHQLQINLSIITSKFDSYPIAHFIHPGSFHSITTIPHLLIRLKELELAPGTIVWDRGYTTQDQVRLVEKDEWKIICGVPQRTNKIKKIISEIDPPFEPDFLVPSKCMNICAVKIDRSIFDTKSSVVVYKNIDRQKNDIRQRVVELAELQKGLVEMQKSCPSKKPEDLKAAVDSLLAGNQKFFNVVISSDGNLPQLTWELNRDALANAERRDGKYLLYASDPELTATEIVQAYFERAFIEDIFHDLKSFEEIAPVRHRLETRVLGIMFVCTLALRLKVALRTMMTSVKAEKKWRPETLLKKLQRVEQVDFHIGEEVDVRFVNLQQKTNEVLEDIGMSHLFERKTCTT